MASDQVTEPRRPGTDGPVPDPQGAVIPCLVECLEVAVQPAGRFDLRRNGRLRRREDGRRNSRGEQGARDAGMKKGQPCRRTLSTGTIRYANNHGRVQPRSQIGRASCRERGCQYVSISGVAGSLKKKKKKKKY